MGGWAYLPPPTRVSEEGSRGRAGHPKKETKMTCNHPSCTCPTIDGGYCSQQCSGGLGTGQTCGCNHQGCVGDAPARRRAS